MSPALVGRAGGSHSMCPFTSMFLSLSPSHSICTKNGKIPSGEDKKQKQIKKSGFQFDIRITRSSISTFPFGSQNISIGGCCGSKSQRQSLWSLARQFPFIGLNVLIYKMGIWPWPVWLSRPESPGFSFC
uniref:Uncharacterized protein n=1 Tax=Molossus molossus TaxID=27622 RepID=A0A7J8ERA0_MOLMO|nr:hypothetical protein HJG59_008694 [Molossus molossus]